jgi:rhodanese-related sulfurtransferase
MCIRFPRLILAAAIAGLAIPAFAEKPLPVLTPAEHALLATSVNAYMSSLPESDWYDVMADDVYKRIKAGKGDFVIVDLRVPKEKKYDVGHVPGAVFIGAPDIAKPQSLAKLPKDKDIIVYCDTAQQSNKAVTALRLLGYRGYSMKWGYMAWSPAPPTAATLEEIKKSITAGYPVEK